MTTVYLRVVDQDTGKIYTGSEVELYALYSREIPGSAWDNNHEIRGVNTSFSWTVRPGGASGFEWLNLKIQVYNKKFPDVEWSLEPGGLVLTNNSGKDIHRESESDRGFGWNGETDSSTGDPPGSLWYGEVSGSAPVPRPSGTMTVVAPVRKLRTVKFMSEGKLVGTAKGNSSYKVTLPDEPSKTDPSLLFGGWGTDGTLETLVGHKGDEYDPKTDITLYAIWATWPVRVHFDPAGGSTPEPFAQKDVIYNRPYGELPTTSRNGWFFSGWWHRTEETETAVYPDTIVTDPFEHVITAFWQKETYHCGIDRNGGTGGSISPLDYQIQDHSLEFSLQRPTREFHTFKEWTVRPWEGSDISYSIQRGQGGNSDVLYLFAHSYGYFTVEAQWDPVKYYVVLHPNGGTIMSGNISRYSYGVRTDLPTDVVRRGHHFDGWFDVFGNHVLFISETSTGDVTFDARWTALTYAVTLAANGGRVVSENVTEYTYGVGAVLPAAGAVVKEGYAFAGWYSDPDFVGDPVTAIGTDDVDDKTFYAKWTALHTVTFLGYDGDELKTEIVPDGSSATPPVPPVRTGYVFSGWSGSYEDVKEDVTVIAEYEMVTYTVTVVPGFGTGGSADPSSYTMPDADVTVSLTRPTPPEGTEFGGWIVPAGLLLTGDSFVIPAGYVGDIVVGVRYEGEYTYSIRGRRWQKLYSASLDTPVYAADTDAATAAKEMRRVPWKETSGDFASCLTAHPGIEETDTSNVRSREYFDAAAFCAGHENGMHRVYAQAVCYRFSLPGSAVGVTMQKLDVSVAGDPYLRDGARLAVMVSPSGVIPEDYETCVTGDMRAERVVKRTVSADGLRWYGANETVELSKEGGIELDSFLYVFLFLENYSYSRGEYVEGSACIYPELRIGVSSNIPEWSLDEVNPCYENRSHTYNVLRDGAVPGRPGDDVTGIQTFMAQLDGSPFDHECYGQGDAGPQGCAGLRSVYAALYEGRLVPVPWSVIVASGRRCRRSVGAAFSVRLDSVTPAGESSAVRAWQLSVSSLFVPFAVPTGFRASSVRVDWGSWPGSATSGGRFNVWLKRGAYVSAYPIDELKDPVLYDASLPSTGGYELLGTIDATSEVKTATLSMGNPLDGYVASLLLTAFVSLDDFNPDGSPFHPRGVGTELSVDLVSDPHTVDGLDYGWIPDVTLIG